MHVVIDIFFLAGRLLIFCFAKIFPPCVSFHLKNQNHNLATPILDPVVAKIIARCCSFSAIIPVFRENRFG
jgi:hypothetical protein